MVGQCYSKEIAKVRSLYQLKREWNCVIGSDILVTAEIRPSQNSQWVEEHLIILTRSKLWGV